MFNERQVLKKNIVPLSGEIRLDVVNKIHTPHDRYRLVCAGGHRPIHASWVAVGRIRVLFN